MRTSSIEKLALATTDDNALSFGLLGSRIMIGITLAYFLMVHFRDSVGMETHPVFAVSAVAICSMLILLGILSRPSALILIVIILCYNKLLLPDEPGHPWEELLILYSAFYVLILFSGAGRYSLDAFFFKISEKG